MYGQKTPQTCEERLAEQELTSEKGRDLSSDVHFILFHGEKYQTHEKVRISNYFLGTFKERPDKYATLLSDHVASNKPSFRHILMRIGGCFYLLSC